MVGVAAARVPSRSEVVLIGPVRAGKSTVATLVGARLGLPVVHLDTLRWAYYHELGYDEAHAARVRRTEGFLALSRYWKPFEIHAVERVLADYRDCVFDFGAGHSGYDEPDQADRARRALAPFRHVLLLVPTPDPELSVQVLRERIGPWTPTPPHEPFFDFERYFIHHPVNHALATATIYTHGRTPDETCEEILCRLS